MSKSKIIIYFLILSLFTVLNAQEKRFKIHTVAFYNLENLFDTINDPNKFDEYSPIMEIKTNRGEAYKQKLHNMARVLADIGAEVTQNTPSLIGVCEIENEAVLQALVNDALLGKNEYSFVHFDSPDVRGIDVALLYKKNIFKPLQSSSHELKIYDETTSKRIYSRDLLLVSGKLENELIHIIVNHWPSRRGGEARSRPKRIAAAKLNKHLVDSLQAINPYAKIIMMGDLNDNPNNGSIKSILKAEKNKNKVGLKGIYNPFMNFYKNGLGTTAYRDSWSLFDQIMLTKPLLDKDYSKLNFYKAGIYNNNYLIQQTGKYKGYPFRSWSNRGFSHGFSDHFPVYIYLIKAL